MDLTKFSGRNRILIMLIIPLAILALFYSLYFAESMDTISKLKKENEAIKQEIDKANQLAARYEKIKAINLELQKKMDYLIGLLPKETEVSGLLKRVSELGIQQGLQVTLWRPKDKVVHESKEIYQLPVEVKMRGKYHSFGLFFSEIAKIERVVNVNSFEFKAGNIDERGELRKEGEPTNINANLMIATYSLIPEEEKKKLKEEKKK